MPRLKALYVFGPQDPTPESLPKEGDRSQKALTTALAEEPETWYARRGNQFSHRISTEWASTLVACDGIIAFDSVLCTGPRHFNSPAWGTVNIDALNAAAASPAAANVPAFGIATHSLDGCASCGSAPEGWAVWGEEVFTSQRDSHGRRTSDSCTTDIGRFPLLAPPPMHSASLRVAMCPTGQSVRSRIPNVGKGKQAKACFIPRCLDCIRDRYCSGCHRWWCESCYIGPLAGPPGGHAGLHSGAHHVSSPPPNTGAVSVNESVDSVHKIRDGICADGKCARPQP